LIAAPGAAAAAVMPGVRSTPGLPRGGDARGAARGQPNLGEISAKPHLYERCIRVSVVLRNAFTCSVGADLGRAAEKPLVADR